MDVPPHESMEDLVDYAHDFDRWSIWTNAILDPEHALEQQTTTAKIKIEAHKNGRKKKKLTSLLRAVHATRSGVKCIISHTAAGA